MLIGVISDTHDNLVGLKKAIDIFKDKKVEMIVHCGDWVSPFTLEFFDDEIKDFNIPVKSVVGNNHGDIKRIISTNTKMRNPIEWSKDVTLEFEVDDKKAIIYHGDDYFILEALIGCQKYDVIFTGHTHTVRNEVVGRTLVVNPGATCYSARGKIVDKASISIYDSKVSRAEIIYFI